MSKRLFVISGVIALIFGMTAGMQTAYADNFGKMIGKALRNAPSSHSFNGLRNAGSNFNRVGNVGRSMHGMSNSSQNPLGNILNGLGNMNRSGNHSSNGNNPFGSGGDFGNFLQDAMGGGFGQNRYDDRHHEDGYAKAYRDVGIANAVAQVVSTLAIVGMEQQQARYGQQAVYGQQAYAPAGGGYATERVLVSPGHYEEVKVWIPEIVDIQTGIRSGGYYELRQRWVPDVYEYRPVWTAR